MNLLQTLLVYMSLVFATSVQTAPEPGAIPEMPDYATAQVQATAVPTPVPTAVPTVAITPNPAYRTIQMGDRGQPVLELQEKLQEYGYYEGELDGAYGNQTRKAVEYFQYMHGLTADGIAGRHTLTVLYEYQDIRMPLRVEITPSPTPTAQMMAAYTPVPSTPAPAVSIAPPVTLQPSIQPTETPLAMDGFKVVVNGNATELKAFQNGEAVYLPIVEVLNALGINVISSSSPNLDEYAFASNFSFVRFTCSENQAGEPVDLQAYRNDEPQLLPKRSLYRQNDVLYAPVASVEVICGIKVTVDQETKQIAITAAE